MRTAEKIGSENLRKPEIAVAVDAAKLARSERTMINADWVLQRLVDEAEADLADLYDAETGDLKPIHEWPKVWRRGLVAGVDVEVILEDGAEIGRVKKIKLSDRVRRLELIGKHVKINAFQNNVHHTGLNGLGERLERAKRRLASDHEEQGESR